MAKELSSPCGDKLQYKSKDAKIYNKTLSSPCGDKLQ